MIISKQTTLENFRVFLRIFFLLWKPSKLNPLKYSADFKQIVILEYIRNMQIYIIYGIWKPGEGELFDHTESLGKVCFF